MKRYLTIVFITLFSSLAIFGQDEVSLFPPKPEPAVYVHDYSHFLTESQRNILEQELRAMSDTTSSQIVVMIRPDIGDYDRASYAIQLGNLWGVGQSQKDNGVIMLIVTEGSQRGIFISTGYGVEGALTDVASSRIAREMVNYFKAQDYFGGVQYGINSIIKAIHGEYSAEPKTPESPEMWVILLILFGIITIIILLAIFGKFQTQTFSGTDTFGQRRNSGWGGGSVWGGGSSGWSSGSWGGGSSGGGWGGGSFGGGSFGGGGGGASW
ncbi:MAG: TPM domain-containing protein [Saprospiraceae bacterium]|nr:TPM domain-containing protein [Saprospiraceae bacterium]